MSCQHLNTQIWEPHLAGARKCLDCGMVYNPNMTPKWHVEPPSDKQIIEKLRKQNEKLKDALIAIENYINLAKSEAEVLACMLLARQAIKEFESDEGK